jgi:parallel beta-helix repeat protein
MMAALLLALGGLPASQADTPKVASGAEIWVGLDQGDFRGKDQRALQATVDYVAGLGGGTVHIGPGRYQMRNALTLRDHVHLAGTPGKTILVACAGIETPLAADGDCNERQITLEDPLGFRVGDGVAILDQGNASGFAVTTATLTGQTDARTFRLSAPLYLDYLVSQKATARLAFPVVGGWNVKNATVEGLTIDGQNGQAGRLDGCRGGGIYLFQCSGITVRNCIVRGYCGDGISFQVSDQITVEDCVCENNTGLGLHPGSGSQHPVVRRNRSLNNGKDGLYVCWRVKHGLFEQNEIEGNKGAGISIGHKDTDNRFCKNIIVDNGGPGVLFRNESEPMGAHRNTFEENRILDNASSKSGNGTQACIIISGHHHGLVFHDNIIGRSQSGSGVVGILCSQSAKDLQASQNEFRNVQAEIRQDGR